MEEALKNYNNAKSNLSSAATGVGSANSALLTAATALQFAIDKEVRDTQAQAATTTGVTAAAQVQSA